MPTNVYEHLGRVLAPGHEIFTGGKARRVWRVGRIRADPTDRTLLGKLGWASEGKEVDVPRWSPDVRDWVTDLQPARDGGVVPFGF
jgi:hypothetical protein